MISPSFLTAKRNVESLHDEYVGDGVGAAVILILGNAVMARISISGSSIVVTSLIVAFVNSPNSSVSASLFISSSNVPDVIESVTAKSAVSPSIIADVSSSPEHSSTDAQSVSFANS